MLCIVWLFAGFDSVQRHLVFKNLRRMTQGSVLLARLVYQTWLYG